MRERAYLIEFSVENTIGNNLLLLILKDRHYARNITNNQIWEMAQEKGMKGWERTDISTPWSSWICGQASNHCPCFSRTRSGPRGSSQNSPRIGRSPANAFPSITTIILTFLLTLFTIAREVALPIFVSKRMGKKKCKTYKVEGM